MTQYLVAIYHPDDYDPSVAEDEAMSRGIDALNDEMKAAGVRIFVGGLHPASSARSLRVQPGGKVLITDGPYLETKEYIASFYLLDCESQERAQQIAADMPWADEEPVEVWPILHESPTNP